MRIAGAPVRIGSVAEAIHVHRLGYVSEDRKHEGLILMHSVLDNAASPCGGGSRTASASSPTPASGRRCVPTSRGSRSRRPRSTRSSATCPAANQQKISVAKWLAAGTRLLIVDEPTVGIDIKSKAYLHQLLRELSDAGTPILLITSDMPEMITLADRIAVMSDYRITGTLENTRDYAEMSEKIMHLIHAQAA